MKIAMIVVVMVMMMLVMSSSAAAVAAFVLWTPPTPPPTTPPPPFEGTVVAPSSTTIISPSSGPLKKDPNKQVGIFYQLWFGPPPANFWGLNCEWGIPELGKYVSADLKIIDQHTEWLASAGIDFVFIDWSNNCFYMADGSSQHKHIEDSTYTFVKRQVQRKKEGKPYLQYCIFIGSCKDFANPLGGPNAGCELVHDPVKGMTKKADQIYDQYIKDPEFASLYWNLDGKPFLSSFVIFCEKEGRTWSHPKFTYRPMTADIKERFPKDIFWSTIENRFEQGYTSGKDGGVECVTVNPMLRGTWPPDENPNPGPGKMQSVGRKNGATFRRMWDHAISLKPKIVMVGWWNQWTGCPENHSGHNENWDQEYSLDIEPMKGGHGDLYLQIMKEQISKYKNS